MATKKAPGLGRAGSKAGAGKSARDYLEMATVDSLESLEELGISPANAQAAEAKLERQLAQVEEERVNMRWARSPLNLIRQAAELAGVPYQTYIKMTVFRQAVEDLNALKKVKQEA